MRFLLLPLLIASAAAQSPITFPEDGGVVDVRASGARPDDDRDDTAAIQKALDQHPGGNRIIYLPPGRWVVRDTLKWPVNSVTLEHVTLRGQRRFGWWNCHQMVFARGIESENAVPALFNEKDSWGTVTLVDSKLVGKGADAKTPGILNQRQMYLRNVSVSGYAKSVDHADKGRDKGDVVPEGVIAENTSHANVTSLFRDVPDKTFATAGPVKHLPVKESPVVPWGDVAKDWVNIVKFGADPAGKADSSPALQAAVDSGAKTVYLPAGARFRFDSEVMLRDNGGRLWILGMKTEKIGTIIETVNGGITDAAGIFIYSNQGWDETVPAFVTHDSTATLAGINERNYNRRPVSFWFRETQGDETRESKSPAWVFLSR